MFTKDTQLDKKKGKLNQNEIKQTGGEKIKTNNDKGLTNAFLEVHEEKRQPICPACGGKFVYHRSRTNDIHCRRCGKNFEWGEK